MACEFNRAVSDYLEYAQGTEYDALANFTISAWGRPANTTQAKDIFSRWRFSGPADKGFICTFHSNGKLFFECAKTATTTETVLSATSYSANVWTHAGFTYSGSNDDDLLQVFFNGAEDSASVQAANATQIHSPSQNIFIGSQAGVSNEFAGGLAEIAAWNVVLDDIEIAALAAGANPLRIRPGNLIGYWPLWKSGDPMTAEMSGKGHVNIASTTPDDAVDHPPVQLYSPFRLGATIVPFGTAGGASLVKIINETVDTSEELIQRLSRIRAVNESEAVTEGTVRSLGLVRLVAGTLSIAEGTLTTRALRRVVNETQTVTEAASRLLAMTVIVDATEGVTEATIDQLGLVRVLDEVESVTEAVNRLGSLFREISETQVVSESVLSTRALRRLVAETEAIAESTPIVSRVLTRILDESETITDAAAAIRGLIKIITGTETITEAPPLTLLATPSANAGDVVGGLFGSIPGAGVVGSLFG